MHKRWLTVDEPITHFFLGPFLLNTALQLAIIVATASLAFRHREYLGRISLFSLLVWTTSVSILLASNVDVRPWENAFWTGRPLRELDAVDVLQSCVLGAGCTCLVRWVFARRAAAPAKDSIVSKPNS